MILGFAHITKNVLYERGSDAVVNSPAKWPLMARHATLHWLTLRQNDGLTEEIVEYDTGVVDQPARIEYSAGCVWLPSRDREVEKRFFCEGLGFRNDGHAEIIRLASPVAEWKVTLNVIQEVGSPLDPPLDTEGCAALAFYTSDVEADRDHLLKHGGRTPTDPFTVTLDRKMKIIMLRSPEGTIIELIQVIRQPQGEELEWARAEAKKLGLK